MAVQTSYSEGHAPGRAGIIVGSDFDSETGYCMEFFGIGFGLAVSQGTVPQGPKGVVLGGDELSFWGISIRDVTVESAEFIDKYGQFKNVGVLTRGKIWVAPAVAVAVNDPVHFDTVTGVLTNVGAEGPVRGARWVTSTGLNGLALVELPGQRRSV